jgi:hypothetical protein
VSEQKSESIGPDNVLAEQGDEAFFALVDTARLYPEAALREAAAMIQELKGKKAATSSAEVMVFDLRDVFESIAAIDDEITRTQLIGQLNMLKVPALTKALIQQEVKAARQTMWEEGEQTKECVYHCQRMRLALNTLELVRGLVTYYSARRSVPPGAALIETLFCLNTYVFDIFDTVPVLLYESATPGCGKTVSLERHEAICCSAHLMVNPSPATIYRMVEDEAPLVILDEAEWLDCKDPQAVDVSMLFNAGYKKGAKVPRCVEVNGEQRVRWFAVFSPKIAAKIGAFSGTLLGRGIVIHLSKTYGLRQSFARVVRREAAPLKQQLEAYAVQKRAALEELYEQQPDETYWPWLTAREAELYMPLLMHVRLIAQECGEEGEAFEREAVAVVREFTTAKAKLVIDEDDRLARTLELLEVLEARLKSLLERKKIDQRWRESISNQVTAGALLKELSEKESWGNYLEGRKHDKARTITIGRFLRSFRPESKHDREGTNYNLLDLALKLAGHVPPEIQSQFRTLLEQLNQAEEARPPADWTPREHCLKAPMEGNEVADATSFDPEDGLCDISGDNSNPGDNSNSRVVTHEAAANQGLGSTCDNLTSFPQGDTGPCEAAGTSTSDDARKISNTPPEKDVNLSPPPATDSSISGYVVTTQNSELSPAPELSPEVSSPPSEEPRAGDKSDTSNNSKNDGGWIEEDL